MKSIVFINVTRYLTLSLSLVGLACHFAQCTLLLKYQEKAHIPGWFTAGHWQYLAWYILYAISILSSLAICAHAICCKRAHILRGDRNLGIFNTLVSGTVILVDTFFGGQEPWTNGIVEFKVPAKGLITYCNLLDSDHDASYPLLMQRCYLMDCTYIIAIMVSLCWITLLFYTVIAKPARTSKIAKLPNELGWKIPGKGLCKKTVKSPYTENIPEPSFGVPYRDAHPSFERNCYKYETPIAPHREKVQLPESYINQNSSMNQQADQRFSFTRHYPPEHNNFFAPVSSHQASSTDNYNYEQEGYHYQEEPWYPAQPHKSYR